MTGDRNFEGGMGSATTFEEKGSNARGCNTEDNLLMGAQFIAKGIIEVGLASAPRPMKKEDLPCSIGDGRNDLVKCSSLIWVQFGNMLFCQSLLFIHIICMLLLDEVIAQNGPLVHIRQWHSVPILQPPIGMREKLINQIKAQVLNLLLRRLQNLSIVLNVITEIITDMMPKPIP